MTVCNLTSCRSGKLVRMMVTEYCPAGTGGKTFIPILIDSLALFLLPFSCLLLFTLCFLLFLNFVNQGKSHDHITPAYESTFPQLRAVASAK